MSVLSFVLDVVDLFDGVYKAIMSVPALSFFVTSALFFAIVSLFGLLVSLGQKRKL